MSVVETAGRLRPITLRRFAGRDRVFTAAVVVAGLFVLIAVFAPLIAPADPTDADPLAVHQGPSSAHLLGTDEVGRDILSRLIVGTRLSLLGPALVILFATAMGVTLALVAAWRGGWTDEVIGRGLDLNFAFPGLVLAVIAVTMFGRGFVAPVIALSIAYTPYVARILRSAARRERSLEYVAACQVQGMSGWRICFRHLLPNVLPLAVVQAAVGFGYALLDLSALAFLGLGVRPPTPEWGLMVANGQPDIVAGQPQVSLCAAATIIIAVVCFNLVGEGMAERLSPEDR